MHRRDAEEALARPICWKKVKKKKSPEHAVMRVRGAHVCMHTHTHRGSREREEAEVTPASPVKGVFLFLFFFFGSAIVMTGTHKDMRRVVCASVNPSV